ncbi:hypothetical protein [uncultured Parasphingorhabdus sp.]|uniref:hypothetical protein n=1 Tax=uncultured Parasphingorhabdus sp. TaxID=2709694 RepID=UPI002AA680E8|nr:hypothetical protein [uncultured Parasphingorhabdus sp.]
MSLAAASLVVPAASVLDSAPAHAKSKYKSRYDGMAAIMNRAVWTAMIALVVIRFRSIDATAAVA